METKDYTYVDKNKWPCGEWNEEPDKIQFEDPETKMPCLIVRGSSGALCGYVGVTEGHPLFGIDYGSCSLKTAKPQGKTDGDDRFSQRIAERMRSRLTCGESWCDHRPESILNVHGGITFSDFCQERSDNHGICHIPANGEPEKVWWFGFDCAHSGDVCPAYEKFYPSFGDYDSYKNVEYVKGEIAQLAKQLRAMGQGNV